MVSLTSGDQLLTVDGQSLVGITQERAAEIMMRTGNVVTLEVAKQGAIYHGLATLLSQPSPVMSRPGYSTGPRRVSERDIRTVGQQQQQQQPLPNGFMPPPHLPPGNRMPQSKSTPALHQSPGGDSQHNYQNQEWLHQQLPYRHPPTVVPSGRSASTQNLTGPPRPPAAGPSEAADPGFYQNLAQPRPRFGSQSSLTSGGQVPPPAARDRPVSAHYPAAPRQFISPPAPEKPNRQYSYESDGGGHPPVQTRETMVRGDNNKPSQPRVRFQDPSQVATLLT